MNQAKNINEASVASHSCAPVNKSATEKNKEKLISVFKVTMPWELQYHYRTNRGKISYTNDRPTLKALINDGLVVFVEKTNKTILFRYVGK